MEVLRKFGGPAEGGLARVEYGGRAVLLYCGTERGIDGGIKTLI